MKRTEGFSRFASPQGKYRLLKYCRYTVQAIH